MLQISGIASNLSFDVWDENGFVTEVRMMHYAKCPVCGRDALAFTDTTRTEALKPGFAKASTNDALITFHRLFSQPHEFSI